MAIVVRRRADVVLFLLRHNYGGLKPSYLWERLRVKGEILERESRLGSMGWKGCFIPKRVAVPHKTDSSQGLSVCMPLRQRRISLLALHRPSQFPTRPTAFPL
jgi:hypothetical protein